ncbi:MAG: hypothetical protein AABW68_02455 [archaeon]
MADPTVPVHDEPSIIEIIQNMVKEGESEEKVLSTLSQLGVDPKKAQRLLLLAQADTFALLQNEISKIVKQNIETEKKGLNQFIQTEAQSAVQGVKQNLSAEIKSDLSSYEKQVSQDRKGFESQTIDTVAKFTDLSERIRVRVNELGKDVQQIKVDQDEMKLRGVGTQNRMISLLLLGIGVLFVLAALGMFVFNFGAVLSIESIIVFIVMALIGVTAMFVSTLV